jgi:hypothetical protein
MDPEPFITRKLPFSRNNIATRALSLIHHRRRRKNRNVGNAFADVFLQMDDDAPGGYSSINAGVLTV